MSSDEDSYDPVEPIVIDNGSYHMKTGFAGDDAPRAVFPTIIGNPKHRSLLAGAAEKDFYVGDEAHMKWGMLDSNRPIKRGFINDWDGMEKVWHHTMYNELRVDPEEHRVLMIDKNGDSGERKKMSEIMFEKFKVSGLYFSMQSLLCLYARGKTTGVVLDSGYETTDITPIYEGKVVRHAIKQLEFGGKHITEYLRKILAERGYNFLTNCERETVNHMKESMCRVSTDISYGKENDSAKSSSEDQDYELPDGQFITLTEEPFKATEALFEPELLGLENTPGFPAALNDCILKCFGNPVPNHFSLYHNITLFGGNTMFEGISERLSAELREIIPSSMTSKVTTPPERKCSAWIGGSMYALSSAIEDKWIMLTEYDEFGTDIVETKCPSDILPLC